MRVESWRTFNYLKSEDLKSLGIYCQNKLVADIIAFGW